MGAYQVLERACHAGLMRMNLLSSFVPTTLRFAYAQDLQTSRHLSVHHSQSAVSWVLASDEFDLLFQNGWVRPCLKHMNFKKGEKATQR